MKRNNPAARLRALLEKSNGHQKNKSAAEIWAILLNVDPTDKGVLLQRIGHVLALPKVIRDAVVQIPEVEHTVYLKWLHRAETAFGQLNFQIEWQQFYQHFSPEVLYGIEVCAELLSRERPEKELDEAILKNILDDATSLLAGIQESTINQTLKDFLIEHLTLLRDAINEYEIRGSKPLEAEVERLIGAVSQRPERWHEAQKADSGKAFWEIMGRVGLVVGIAGGLLKIGQDIIKSTPSAPEHVVEENPSPPIAKPKALDASET